MCKGKAVYSLVVLVALLLCGGWLLYEQYYGEQGCEMTWMYQWPRYLRVPMDKDVEDAHPQYGLYLYTESQQKEGGPSTFTSRPSGVPVLFIPGNAGSHKQVRSAGSIALRMHQAEFNHLRHFDFFTVKLNEELSGVFGGVLQRQVEYVACCIRHIISLYSYLPTRPASVVIIAHSMGGVIAHALFTLPSFNASSVDTIIAMASPLLRPVISLDPLLQEFYDRIHERPGYGNQTLVSLAGGQRDVMVPTLLSAVPHAINLATPAVPRNWVSADHQAIVWCRRVQLALSRALFLMQDPSRYELTRDKQFKDKMMRHFLLHGGEVPPVTSSQSSVRISTARVAMVNGNNSMAGGVAYWQEGMKAKYEYVGLPLVSQTPVLVTSNTGRGSWVFMCKAAKDKNRKQLQCIDLSSKVSLLPPKLGVVKSLVLPPTSWSEGNSILVTAQPSNIHKHALTKGFLRVEWCHALKRELYLQWWGSSVLTPPTHCSLMNISLSPLLELWHTYKASIFSSCGEVRAALIVPWYPHTPLTHSPPTYTHTVTISLSVLVPPPANPPTTAHLLVWSSPNCSVNVSITPDPLEFINKLFVLYFPLLLPWVTTVCIAGPFWRPGLEIVAISILYSITSVGWIPYTDWQMLSTDRIWNGAIPIVIHLIARGLQSCLTGLVGVGVAILQRICRRGIYGWFCLLLSIPCLLVCSGVGVACLIAGLALKTTSKQSGNVLSVFLCLQLLSLPAVVSWIKGLRFHASLSPDPHFTGVLVIICVTMVMVWTLNNPTQANREITRNRYSWQGVCLAVSGLLYCTVHVYRLTALIACYVLLFTARQAMLNQQ